MRFFIEPAKHCRADGSNLYHISPQHIEIVTQAGENELVLYVIFRDRESVTLAACLDTLFDAMPVETDEDIRAYASVSPTAAALMQNTIAGNYLEGALVRGTDPDDKRRKYFVVSLLENVEIESPEDFFERQILRPTAVVLAGCAELYAESAAAAERGGVSVGVLARSVLKGMTFGLLFSGKKVSLDRNLLDLFYTRKTVDGPADPRTILDPSALESYVRRNTVPAHVSIR